MQNVMTVRENRSKRITKNSSEHAASSSLTPRQI